MNVNYTLMAVLAVQAALFGAAWWVGVLALGLARQAGLHWMGMCLAIGLGGLGFVPTLELPLPLALPARNLLLLLGCMLMRRGNALFLRGDTADLEHALLLGVTGVVMLAIGTDPGTHWLWALLMSSALGWVLLRTGVELMRGVLGEAGRLPALLIGVPVLLMGAALMGRAASALVMPPSAALVDLRMPSIAGTALLLAGLVAFTLLQFSLFYLVVRRLLVRLHQVSSQDALTRLPNRRAWATALQAEQVRMQRHPVPTAVAVIDIDGFRQMNGRFGPARGDEVLQSVARCLEDTARATDVVARIGSAQFGVLLPDTDADGALEAAERLRQAVAGMNLRIDEERLPLTISVGLAVQPVELAQQLNYAGMQLRADLALSQARAAGGNLVQLDRRPSIVPG